MTEIGRVANISAEGITGHHQGHNGDLVGDFVVETALHAIAPNLIGVNGFPMLLENAFEGWETGGDLFNFIKRISFTLF